MFDETKLAQYNRTSATISMKDWILLDLLGLLNIIPIAGTIAYIVIILVIAFSSSTAISLKNRVLVNLLWLALQIVASLIFLFVFGGLALIMNATNGL